MGSKRGCSLKLKKLQIFGLLGADVKVSRYTHSEANGKLRGVTMFLRCLASLVASQQYLRQLRTKLRLSSFDIIAHISPSH